jgi:hypothetical protein
MRCRRAALFVLMASTSFATTQQEASLLHIPEQKLILVARGDLRRIDAFDDRNGLNVWNAPGVAVPRLQASSGQLAAFGDPLENRVVIVTTSNRTSRTFAVPETPAAMLFAGDALYVLSRDGNALTRISGTESRSIQTSPDPTHLASNGQRLFVYSAITGTIDEYSLGELETGRKTGRVPAFGSDFAVDARRGYLVYPRSGKMFTVSLATLQKDEEFDVGAVPVDLDLESDPNLISAGVVAVADPSSKRIWRVERTQSNAEAVGRGFIRGLLGLGLYSPRSAEFPTGVDRVWKSGEKRLAYDSSTGKLYQLTSGKSRLLTTVAWWGASAIAGEFLVLWDEQQQALQFRRFRGPSATVRPLQKMN